MAVTVKHRPHIGMPTGLSSVGVNQALHLQAPPLLITRPSGRSGRCASRPWSEASSRAGPRALAWAGPSACSRSCRPRPMQPRLPAGWRLCCSASPARHLPSRSAAQLYLLLVTATLQSGWFTSALTRPKGDAPLGASLVLLGLLAACMRFCCLADWRCSGARSLLWSFFKQALHHLVCCPASAVQRQHYMTGYVQPAWGYHTLQCVN